jgi:sRNA-binding regulator protein Hfq
MLREKEYLKWLKRKRSKLVYKHKITNAIAMFNLVVKWHIKARVSPLIKR